MKIILKKKNEQLDKKNVFFCVFVGFVFKCTVHTYEQDTKKKMKEKTVTSFQVLQKKKQINTYTNR